MVILIKSPQVKMLREKKVISCRLLHVTVEKGEQK